MRRHRFEHLPHRSRCRSNVCGRPERAASKRLRRLAAHWNSIEAPKHSAVELITQSSDVAESRFNTFHWHVRGHPNFSNPFRHNPLDSPTDGFFILGKQAENPGGRKIANRGK